MYILLFNYTLDNNKDLLVIFPFQSQGFRVKFQKRIQSFRINSTKFKDEEVIKLSYLYQYALLQLKFYVLEIFLEVVY